MANIARVFNFPAPEPGYFRSNRMENKKFGHFSLFRSLLQTDWAKDTAKMALWVRLLGEASYRVRTVEFASKQWELSNGQLVTTAAILARKLRDQDGKEKSPQAVTRMLNFFVREGMISTEGNRFGTVITITNYASYQVVLPDEPSDEPSDKGKASNGAGLRLVADEPSDRPPDEQNKKVLNKNINNKTSSSENSGESSDARLKRFLSAHPEAVVYTSSGAKWGSAEDHETAKWISSRVKTINPTCKAPDMTSWSNTVRLMRQIDNRSHQDICALYDWASKHHFWQTNILSPESLRKQWDKLTMQRNAGGEQRPAKPDLDFNNTDWAYEVIR